MGAKVLENKIRPFFVSALLAFKDLWHDRKVTFCLIVSLTSVVAPLLLLFGLKFGIISTMEERFLQDPHKREIKIIGHYKLNKAWFEKLQSRPEVSFIIANTRALNTQVDLLKNHKKFIKSVEIIPTKAGDPLLPKDTPLPAVRSEVLVSHTVALDLGLQTNDILTMIIPRIYENSSEPGRYSLTVIGILPESVFSRNGIFANFKLLKAVDDFKDQYAVPEFGVDHGKTRVEHEVFASARVFAKSLQDVSTLADFIRETGIEVKTHAKDIENIQQTEKVLSFIVKVIAWVAILGGTVSLAGFLIANVDRKRQHLAMLRLLGFTAFSIAMYPVMQSLVIATLGFALAIGGYALGASAFDQMLGAYMQETGFICRLSNQQILFAYFVTDIVVFGAAIIGGIRAIQIEPAETFRQQ
jgi:putative ABC transport system permease protein